MWAYEGVLTEEQEPITIVRGRLVGGSSAVNGSSFFRGTRDDYDDWGSELWSWPHVLEAFRRLETDADFGGEAHGQSGPIPVQRHPSDEWGPMDAAFYEAVLAGGFPEQSDLNLPDRFGVGPTPRNIRHGRRVDAAAGYLEPARDRPNLTVVGGAFVRRVVFEGNRATGVEVEHGGRTAVVRTGAVVLSAGGIASPQLLFLSGVGAPDELRAAGLPVVTALPGVGKNLQDHALLNYELTPVEDAVPGPETPYAPASLHFTADDSELESDLRILFGALPASDWTPPYIALVTQVQRGVGRGRLHFSSADPAGPPRIEYRYFADAEDRRRGRQVLRVGAELLASEPLARLAAHVEGPSKEELGSDRALDAWILRNAMTCYHTVGTCKLGPADDPDAVVDEGCHVLGVDDLYVADLSIAPLVPRAGTHATAIMIGERASELIASDL
jgi:choline dehydrogenase-like flavoprotein